jgi:hypothetical protein
MRSFATSTLMKRALQATAILALGETGVQAQTPASTTTGPQGSWLYTVTVPGLSPPVFQGLETYAAGGGYEETDQLSYRLGYLASPGHGAWKTTRAGAFLLTFQQLTFDNTGNPTGISKILQTATIASDGNSYAGSGTFAYYDTNGHLIPGASGTFAIHATRIAVQAIQTTAVAAPANETVTSRQIVLDGTGSTSADGKPLKYYWTMAPGSPSAAISYYDTPAPLVQFSARGAYSFLLTVTDSSGSTATSVATVNFVGY